MALQQWLERTIRSGEFRRRRVMREWQRSTFDVKLWNFMAMGDTVQSKGYVWWSRSLHRIQGTATARVRWQAIRCLPQTPEELEAWNFQGSNFMESLHIGVGRQYNLTVRRYLMRGVSPNQAHSTALDDIDHHSRQVLWQAVTELLVSGATASADLGPAGSMTNVDLMCGANCQTGLERVRQRVFR